MSDDKRFQLENPSGTSGAFTVGQLETGGFFEVNSVTQQEVEAMKIGDSIEYRDDARILRLADHQTEKHTFPERMKEAHCLCGRIFIAGEKPEERDGSGNITQPDAEAAQAHQRECAAYQDHLANCYCRGQGGNNPHDIKPQTPNYLTLLWSCEACELVKIAVEVPIRARSVELKYWFGRLVGPRVTVSQQENGCPASHNETISLLVPMGEVGTRGATRVGGPLK